MKLNLHDRLLMKMRSFPGQAGNRVRALEGLFMRYGAGLLWHEGVIRCRFEDSEDDPEQGARTLAQYEEGLAEEETDHQEFVAMMAKHDAPLPERDFVYKGPVEQIRWALANAEEQVAGGAPCVVVRSFYGMSEQGGAPLQEVPDDVQPDYLAAAREVCALVLACPLEDERGDMERNKKMVRSIIKDLDKRFGKAELPDVSYVTWEAPKPEPVPEPVPVREYSPEVTAQVKAMWEAAMEGRSAKVEGTPHKSH